MVERTSRSADPAQSMEDALRRAGDREAARGAASRLAHVMVDDAVAVSPGADTIVGAVRRLVEEGCPWRADAFAVLLHALKHSYVWRARRASVRTYRGEYDRAIAQEEAVFGMLGGFDALVRDSLVDRDPETRSLACLLLSWISADPVGDRELVQMLVDAERDDLARACAAEALVRLNGSDAVRFLEDESVVVRQRIAFYFEASLRGGIPVEMGPAVAKLVEGVLREPTLRLWLAEEL